MLAAPCMEAVVGGGHALVGGGRARAQWEGGGHALSGREEGTRSVGRAVAQGVQRRRRALHAAVVYR